MPIYEPTCDLRELAEVHLGKPIAVSACAALWRCPACYRKHRGLLMVAANEYKCLSKHPCGGGAGQWMKALKQVSGEITVLGASA